MRLPVCICLALVLLHTSASPYDPPDDSTGKTRGPYKKYTLEDLADALKAALDPGDNRSTKRLAKEFGVPRGTIQRHMELGPEGRPNIEGEPQHQRTKAYLSYTQEQDLAAYCNWMAERGWPLTTAVVRDMACGIIRRQGGRDVPSLKWAQRFGTKFGFSKRPAKENKPRAGQVHPDTVRDFIDLLRKMIQDNNLEGDHIINMNETGWGRKQQFQHSKFLFKRGSKNVCIRQAFSVEHITSVHAGCADGSLLPTMLIYKKSMPSWPQDPDDLPDGWAFATSESGFMTKFIFFQWISLILLPFAKKKRSRILCIIDNASCHLCVNSIDLCREHGIELLALPPNTTWILQPFDQIFSLLKTTLYKIAYEHSLMLQGNVINKNNFIYALKSAVSRAFTKHVIQNSFRVTGIFPTSFDILDLTSCIDISSDHNTSPQNASSENNEPTSLPCASCGAIKPCSTCIRQSNILVKMGLLKDPISALILTPPSSDPRVKAGRKITGARLLTSDSIRQTLYERTTNGKKDRGKNVSVPITEEAVPIVATPSSNDAAIDSPVTSPPSLQYHDSPTVSVDPSTNLPDIKALPRRPKRKSKKPNDDIYDYTCHDNDVPISQPRKKKGKKTDKSPAQSVTHVSRQYCTECGQLSHVNDVSNFISCDQCTSSFHFDCLSNAQRSGADLASIAGISWLCEVCQADCENVNATVVCVVCMGTIDTWKCYDYVKCGIEGCMTYHHYQCLGEDVIRQINACASSRRKWQCNACEKEE